MRISWIIAIPAALALAACKPPATRSKDVNQQHGTQHPAEHTVKQQDGIQPVSDHTVEEGQLADFLAHLADYRQVKNLRIDDEMSCAALQQVMTLDDLENLYILYNGCDQFPTLSRVPPRLRHLSLHLPVNTESLPSSLSALGSLQSLDVDCPSLQSVGTAVLALRHLETLGLTQTGVASLPDELGKLPALKHIYIGLTDGAEELESSFEAKFPRIDVVIN
jgi:hypothetical protein